MLSADEFLEKCLMEDPSKHAQVDKPKISITRGKSNIGSLLGGTVLSVVLLAGGFIALGGKAIVTPGSVGVAVTAPASTAVARIVPTALARPTVVVQRPAQPVSPPVQPTTDEAAKPVQAQPVSEAVVEQVTDANGEQVIIFADHNPPPAGFAPTSLPLDPAALPAEAPRPAEGQCLHGQVFIPGKGCRNPVKKTVAATAVPVATIIHLFRLRMAHFFQREMRDSVRTPKGLRLQFTWQHSIRKW